MIIKHIATSVSTNVDVQQFDQNLITLWCDEQTKGRGQRGNSWESAKGQNLTFSILIKPQRLRAEDQFVLSKIISTVIVETLGTYGIDAAIKWPNDIYVGNKKICGILIECNISGNGMVSQAVIGVGLNINQKYFVSDAPNPTSMAIELKGEYSREEILEDICRRFEIKYDIMSEGLYTTLNRAYIRSLYRKEGFHLYEDDTRGLFKAKIDGITDYGALILRYEDGKKKEYQFKEVAFVIEDMKKGTIKRCPACGNDFVCHHDDITICHCSAISLNDKQIEKAKSYTGCLCASCLKSL